MRNCKIGSFCSVAENVKIGFGNHPINRISTSPVFYTSRNIFGKSFCVDESVKEFHETFIGNDVLIGANVFIKDGINIGDGAIVGAGSVVTKDVDPYEVVGGNPARHLKYRFNETLRKKIISLQWWDWSDEELANNILFVKNFGLDDREL